MARHFGALLLGLVMTCIARAQVVDLASCLTSPEVVYDARAGVLRLAHSQLLTDETGATDWLQSEPLSDTVYAKKIFELDSADVTSAELLLFGSAKNLTFNGKPLNAERLPSTGWSRAKVPVNLLKAGANEILLWGGGSLLVEPSKKPGRSAKSIDGGLTWTQHNLTGKGNVEGEYLIRLRLGRYAPRGWAVSPVIDLWGGGLAAPRKIDALMAT